MDERDGACGLVEFPELTFSAPGVYTYKIKELTESDANWTKDDSEFPVVITVTDDGNGNMLAAVDYPGGYPIFTNTYYKAPLIVAFSACLEAAEGETLEENQVNFGLYDEDENLLGVIPNGPPADIASLGSRAIQIPPLNDDSPAPMSSDTDSAAKLRPQPRYAIIRPCDDEPDQNCQPDFCTDENGNIICPIELTGTGVYNFTLKELPSAENNYGADSQAFGITVKVTEEDGDLTACVNFPDGCPKFTVPKTEGPGQPQPPGGGPAPWPPPDPDPAPVQVCAYVQAKLAVSGPYASNTRYCFGLYDDCGLWMGLTCNVGNCIRFRPLCFSSPGIYKYTIREMAQSRFGYTSAAYGFPVVIIVSEDDAGGLIATVKYPNGMPVFRKCICNPCRNSPYGGGRQNQPCSPQGMVYPRNPFC
ncbi:MAG: hypothetical protein LBD16_07740 [Oscillospiraceae bacterium]|jgi:pilin isopeptide linkage protein|nr:hypothetical protein [Oscillospiraceae bacterium]